jgi:hypothetical protein
MAATEYLRRYRSRRADVGTTDLDDFVAPIGTHAITASASR